MSEWKEKTISEIVTLIGGGTPKTSVSEYWDGHIPWLSVVDFNNGKKYVFDTEKKITEEGLENSSTKLLEKGDIIISARGTVGVVAMLGKQMAFNQSCYGVRANENSSNEYVYYLLKDRVSNFLQYSHGGVFDTITRDTFREIDILLPPLEEQNAIASVLSSLDDKIDLLHRQNQTLEQMAETLFRQWFVEEADEGWEWHQLDEFVDVQRGLSYKGAGLTDRENGVPMHNLNSVFEGGGYKESGIKYYKGDFKERHKVYPGDVIVTNTEQGHEHLLIGYPAIVSSNFGDYGIFSQHIYRLGIKSKLSNFFLFHLLKTHDVHEQIAGATNGSTVNMLSKDGVEWVKFRIPPQELIDEFTQMARDYYKKQEFNQTQIRTLTALRDTLLPKLMSGEVRVEKTKES